VAADGTKAPVGAIAICTTPSGATYVSTGSDRADVVDKLSNANLYAGTVEIDVTRNSSGTPVGLTRRVVIAYGAQPRIKSQ